MHVERERDTDLPETESSGEWNEMNGPELDPVAAERAQDRAILGDDREAGDDEAADRGHP